MSDNFVSDVAALAGTGEYPVDRSVEEWAARAFSCLIIAGGLSETSQEVKDSLAIVLAKAPTRVLLDGTIHTMAAHGSYNASKS